MLGTGTLPAPHPRTARLRVSPGSGECWGPQCGQGSEGLMAWAAPHLERRESRGADSALGRGTPGEGWAACVPGEAMSTAPPPTKPSDFQTPFSVATFLKPQNKPPQHTAGIETPVL